MSNPILNSAFNEKENIYQLQDAPMTINGVLNKLGLISVLMFISGGVTWYQFAIGNYDKVMAITTCGFVIGFILAMVTCFVKKAAKYTVPLYAFAEGAALAGISCVLEAQFSGIVINAVALTFITLFSMFMLYSAKIIKVNETFRNTLITVTCSICIFYLISWVLALFGIPIPMLRDSSPISIGFSVLVCGVAAFNLALDFDFIEQAAARFFPKDYEWTAAFGLTVTLVWLYVEILNLLAKLNRR